MSDTPRLDAELKPRLNPEPKPMLGQRLNLTEALLADNVRKQPDAAALVIDKGTTALPLELSYQQLQQHIMRFAGGLKASWTATATEPSPELATQANRHILIALPDGEEFVFAFFGAIAAGFIPIPASNQLTARELAFIANDAAVNWIVSSQELLPDQLLQNHPPPSRIVTTVSPETLNQANELKSYAATRAETPAYMLYTSGTTNQPKAVMHAHRVINGRRPIVSDWLGITQKDRLLHAGALNWSYTLGVGLMDSWAAGATAIVCPTDCSSSAPASASAEKSGAHRKADYWPAAIARNRATVFAAVPGIYRQILKQADNGLRSQLSSLRHGVCAGEALNEALLDEWQNMAQKPLFEALGMTECSTYISSGPTTHTRPGSAGKVQTNRRIAVLKPQQKEQTIEFAADGEEGLLAVHRHEPGLMLGYWQRNEESKNSWLGDWFITGDRVMRDADGYIWHCGRNSDLMNPQGYRVAPQEIEAQLSATSGVAEIAVAELAVGETQRHIVAFIVKVPGAEPSDLQQRLEKTATQQLAAYKCPRAYAFVKSLPRTRNGKLRRADLAQLLAESELLRAARV